MSASKGLVPPLRQEGLKHSFARLFSALDMTFPLTFHLIKGPSVDEHSSQTESSHHESGDSDLTNVAVIHEAGHRFKPLWPHSFYFIFHFYK